MKTIHFLLVASVMFAMTFTFSCSSDSNIVGDSTCSDGTVVIGTQTWHKCNLNVVPSTGNSWCYNGYDNYLGRNVTAEESCAKYGRLYDWMAAMSACPSGFHLPTKEEWDILIDYVGGNTIAGKKLKAKNGWNSNGNGEDAYDFSALPGGVYFYKDGDYFKYAGNYGVWWNAGEDDSEDAYRDMSADYNDTRWYYNDKSSGISVRCLKND